MHRFLHMDLTLLNVKKMVISFIQSPVQQGGGWYY